MEQNQTPNTDINAARRSLQDVVLDDIERRQRDDKKAAEVFLDIMAWEDRQAVIGNKILLIAAALAVVIVLIACAIHYHP